METQTTDYLIIGAGVAGLRAAIELAQSGNVLVVAKDGLKESASEYAQGGIAVALSDDDEVSLHEHDTLYAGDGLCDTHAVRTLVEEGPAAIQELIDWGTEFDKDGASRLLFTREAAHSRNRILHSHGDSTGHEIARTLSRKAASLENIRFASFSGMTDLLLNENGASAAGARLLREETSEFIDIIARSGVLLATGGLGRVFLETTNPDVATGDGVAAAYRAGAEIRDIEFVQFHPTALHVEGAPRFLLSEALRGEGAYLLNAQGERFMERYHSLKELAPRDVVSRSIVREAAKTGADHVLLDMRHAASSLDIPHRFPRIHETCLHYGIDLRNQPAPVYPAAHYAMGGVRTDLHGRTSIPRLYAAGEAASTGVHGANRLASNSLLEGVVFGKRTGIAMSDPPPWKGASQPPPPPLFPSISERELRTLAWTACGVERDGATLNRTLEYLKSLPRGPLTHPNRVDFELRNIWTVLTLIASCALEREESRGGHYRRDFPEKSEQFTSHSIVSLNREIHFAALNPVASVTA